MGSSATVDSGLQGREGSRSCYNGDSVSSKTLGTSWSHGRKLSFSILHRHLDWQCCHKSSIYDELDRHSWRSSCSRTTVISHIRSQQKRISLFKDGRYGWDGIRWGHVRRNGRYGRYGLRRVRSWEVWVGWDTVGACTAEWEVWEVWATEGTEEGCMVVVWEGCKEIPMIPIA